MFTKKPSSWEKPKRKGIGSLRLPKIPKTISTRRENPATPYPEKRFRKWLPEDRDIARLPSTIASTITTGPTRTISPQSPSIMHDVFPRWISELRGKSVKPQNQKQFRTYDPRAHAPFAKMAYDRLRLLPQIIKQNMALINAYLDKP